MNPSFKEYKVWCKNTGNKEGRATSLKEFIEKVEQGKLVKCDCCGEYVDEVHTFRARYDHDRTICEGCSNDGN